MAADKQLLPPFTLLRKAARVALLETTEMEFGGSGRNVGLVNVGMCVMPDTLTLEPPFEERADRTAWPRTTKGLLSD
ncbi:hypothetical protein [Bradyrhizobium algeriense]|uniref:hypothetical protein n=1 Tax=Bradyrhizobium algeriense TaxID=634784 RepID=UPI00308411EC